MWLFLSLTLFGLLQITCSLLTDTVDILTSFGLPAEVHKVTTEDGYILSLIRVPRNSSKVVLLDHGLGSSSDCFVLLGRDMSLSCLLYDIGYDVWLSNHRGNTYSKQSNSMPHPTFYDKKFWDFSLDEMALYDQPAAIDYILNVSQQPNLYYVGHSVGPSQLFALLSMKPEYNDKIKIAVAMSPALYPLAKYKPTLGGLLLSQLTLEYAAFQLLHIYEIFAYNSLEHILNLCTPFLSMCEFIVKTLIGSDWRAIDKSLLPEQIAHLGGGTSTKNVYQTAYNIQPFQRNFTKYDYGPEMNMKKYGTVQPPAYDLSQITVPVALFQSTHDSFVDSHAMDILKKNLKSVMYDHTITGPIGHLDFLVGAHAKDLVYDRIIDIFNDMNRQTTRVVEVEEIVTIEVLSFSEVIV